MNLRKLTNTALSVLLEDEKRESKSVDAIMASHGYGAPQRGAKGHITFTKEKNPDDQMLVDVPGGEWHHMTKGVINKIGHLNDGSLDEYFA